MFARPTALAADAQNTTVPVIQNTVPTSSATTTAPLSLAQMIGDSRLYKIARCESGLKQFREDGKPLISPTHDVGILQINHTHWAEAKRLGLDIFGSEIDNIKMAKIILAQQGYSAWTCNSLV